jgi:hypothetical protein
MYLRTTARRNKDGSVVRYLALAHNQRVGATTLAQVLLNLGWEDRCDPDGLRRLVESRPAGRRGCSTGCGANSGVDSALRQVLGGRRFSTDVERVLFALVANRALDPASKLAAPSGRRTTWRFPGSTEWMTIRPTGRWTC